MGTRADFYVGTGKDAQWLGSIAWDGYPRGRPNQLLVALSEGEYRQAVAAIAKECETHWSDAKTGWPWPWENSGTTDYAYTWLDGAVHVSCFGSKWLEWKAYQAHFDLGEDAPELEKDESQFPTFSTDGATMGPRSGLIVLR